MHRAGTRAWRVDRPDDLRDRLTKLGATLSAQRHLRRGVPARSEPIRVVLVDDHQMVREGLRLLLRTVPDVDVVGEAGSGAEAVTVARRLVPDVVILDLVMAGGDGMEALRQLRRVVPDVPVLILTMHPESEFLVPMLEAGARGYLTKEAAADDLVEAMRAVAAGEVEVRPWVARVLAEAIAEEDPIRTAGDRFRFLSEREQTVLRLLAEGYNGAEVARQLQISRKTVDAYKQRIQEKLGLQHRTDYVRFALEAGVLRA
jgi:two-component system, NarL family, response regulator NreC